jgi:hypothetical protein
MMKVIAVHELIHACGLDNDDHATDDGVFYFPLGSDGKGKIVVPLKGLDNKPMPQRFASAPQLLAKLEACGPRAQPED